MFDMSEMKKKKWDLLWDAWCVASLIGVWPRFIEPRLLSITRLKIAIPDLPNDLEEFKIVQFSDLHWYRGVPDSFVNRMIAAIQGLQPDLIAFTGDFICRSHLEDSERLRDFLRAFHAPFGCFAVLGNHDYEQFVTVSETGDYDVETSSTRSNIARGFKRLFNPVALSTVVTPQAQRVGCHQSLNELLKTTPFQLLENHTVQIPVGKSFLNVSGLGEYTLGRTDVTRAFTDYRTGFPGLILAHNPDTVPYLRQCPGDLILCGHTHGGQVNIPGMWRQFTRMENPAFKRGLKHYHNKAVYINRGVGAVMKFRLFSLPEITQVTLVRGKE